MNRRELIRTVAGTMLVSACTGPVRNACASARESAGLVADGRFQLDVYSRSLQWLRTPAEVAKAVQEIGLKSIDLTVLPSPGHIDPSHVKTALPAFANGLKAEGITVTAITTDITDTDSPYAEAMLSAASELGIRYYSFGGFRYSDQGSYASQLSAIEQRLAKLVKWNEKYRMKGLYQPRAGAGNVGTAFFDLLDVFRKFDPRYVGFRYDTGNMLQATPDTTATQLRIGGAYIGGIAINDAAIKLDLPAWNEGPYSDNHPEILNYGDGGGDNLGNDGGNPMAIGGGGRPLPYRVSMVPVGMGMIHLAALGAVLKEIDFSGPAECQSEWKLGGAEQGAESITLPRQTVIGGLKHNRLMVEQAFAPAWNIDIARPAFMDPKAKPAPGRRQPAGGPGIAPAQGAPAPR